jgi:hypothetical protein
VSSSSVAALSSVAVRASVSYARKAALAQGKALGLDGHRALRGVVADAADVLALLRRAYSVARRNGASPARLAVIARYGSFFAATAAGQTNVRYPKAIMRKLVAWQMFRTF